MPKPWLCLLLVLPLWSTARGDDAYERPPIDYSQSEPTNCISKLQTQIDQGEVQLPSDGKFGYLPALLEALDVRLDSQTLVFSKTSLQRNRISPRTPRAVYFNDEVYIGYCKGGDVLEISVADPQLGAVFYTLDQRKEGAPSFERQTDKCLICHGGSQTDGIPGHLIRSVFTDEHGLPLLAEGTFRVDHTTPLENRWGGWYVTGTHGQQSHLGNFISANGKVARPVDNAKGLNVTELNSYLPIENYLTPHSDVVALMVLEHQVLVHNLLTKANFATREALHYEAELNQSLGEPAGNRMPSTTSRIKNAGDKLLKGLLFAEEAKLSAPIAGTSDFAKDFSLSGPRDSRGRSLRDLELTNRLLKYPCSYLIYSPAYDGLPQEVKTYVAMRLRDVLTSRDKDEAFSHLAAADRKAILEILTATKPDLWPQ